MDTTGCRICKQVFASAQQYIQHKCCKPTEENWIPIVRCGRCDNVFPSNSSLINHFCRRKRKQEVATEKIHKHEVKRLRIEKKEDTKELRNQESSSKQSETTPKTKNGNQVGRGQRTIIGMQNETTPKTKNGNQVGRGRRASLGSRAQIETFKPQNTQDLLREIKEQEIPIRDHLIDRLHKLMKWYIVVHAEFKRDIPTGDGTIVEETRQDYISSPTFIAYNTMDIDQDLPTAFKELFSKFDAQAQQGSGWRLSKLINLDVHTAQSDPLSASSYIELPKQVKNTKGVINIQNKD